MRLGIMLASAAAISLSASMAAADSGDIHRVTGAELVNLRAGPSDQTNVRGRVEAGDEVIELTRDEGWVGVRVLQTGEEGWIYGGLLEQVSQSSFTGGDGGGGVADSGGEEDAGFLRYSSGFNTLVQRINGNLGYPMVAETLEPAQGVLRVVPTEQWLRNASYESHLLAATAFYQLWKNHQNGQWVSLILTDGTEERPYITIEDQEGGPQLSVQSTT